MKKLKLINKFGYGVGDLANGLTFGMSAGFLLAFYTDVLGITAAAAGTLFLVARIWDAINDPMMGSLADKMFARRARKHANSDKPVDKFRAYLLKGSWPVVIAAILMFTAPSGLVGAQKLIWAYVTYIAWGMAYTFINIPYGSLAAVMSADPVERSQLSVWRGIGGLIGGVGIRVVVPIFLVQFADDQAKAYLLAMIVLGVLTFISYIFSYFTTVEIVVHKDAVHEKVKITDSFKVIAKNRPFVAVSVASIAMLLGLLIQGSMTIYYFRENLNALELMSLTALTQLVPMLLAAPLVPQLVKRIGTKATTWSSSLIAAVIFAILFVLPDNVWLYMIFTLLGGLFLMIPNMLVWGMVSDCIDYNHYLSGSRQEGVIYGLYSFVRKMGQAFAGFISGVGLAAIGYTASLEVQSAGTLFGIKFLTIGTPAIAMFIAFLAYKYIWNLTPEKQLEIAEAIGTKNEEN